MSGSANSAYPERFLPVSCPTIFADGLLSLATGHANAKFYFSRIEPSIHGDSTSQVQPVAQVIMPYDGFAAMVMFLNQSLDVMIRDGKISPERVDQLKNMFRTQS